MPVEGLHVCVVFARLCVPPVAGLTDGLFEEEEEEEDVGLLPLGGLSAFRSAALVRHHTSGKADSHGLAHASDWRLHVKRPTRFDPQTRSRSFDPRAARFLHTRFMVLLICIFWSLQMTQKAPSFLLNLTTRAARLR